jgi:site-specific recombinase XerD
MEIATYIMSMKTEINLSDNYRESVMILLSRFSTFFNNQKLFKSMTRDEIMSFLETRYRTPSPGIKEATLIRIFS